MQFYWRQLFRKRNKRHSIKTKNKSKNPTYNWIITSIKHCMYVAVSIQFNSTVIKSVSLFYWIPSEILLLGIFYFLCFHNCKIILFFRYHVLLKSQTLDISFRSTHLTDFLDIMLDFLQSNIVSKLEMKASFHRKKKTRRNFRKSYIRIVSAFQPIKIFEHFLCMLKSKQSQNIRHSN